MTEYAETMLLLVILVGAVAIHIMLSNRKKQAIRREIQRLGGHIVKISEIYGDRDKNTYTYEVEFTDRLGQKFRTSCKAWVRGFGNQLYWNQSPAELMNTAEAVEERAISELKQQVIDKLYTENRQLEQELERLRKTTNVDRK